MTAEKSHTGTCNILILKISLFDSEKSTVDYNPESEQHHAQLDHLLLLETAVFLLHVCNRLYHATHLDQHRECNAEDPLFETVS